MDEKTLKTLIKSLGDKTEIKKNITIKHISYYTLVSSGKDVVEPLTQYLNENKGIHNRDINQEVANILLDICAVHGCKAPLELFIKEAKGISEFKDEAIRGLGFIDDKKSYTTLVSIINDPKESLEYKINAITSLGDLSKYNEKEVLGILNELMDNINSMTEPLVDDDVTYLKNNIIVAINKIVNKDVDATIGEEVTKRRKKE